MRAVSDPAPSVGYQAAAVGADMHSDTDRSEDENEAAAARAGTLNDTDRPEHTSQSNAESVSDAQTDAASLLVTAFSRGSSMREGDFASLLAPGHSASIVTLGKHILGRKGTEAIFSSKLI